MPEPWNKAETLYRAALEREPGERNAFLEKACGGDEALLDEVKSRVVNTWVGRRVQSYEVLSLLGAGGMGEVYRAKDLKLGREVAIKVLREDVASDADRLSRFEREARAASSLNHPNIVTIHDIRLRGSSSRRVAGGEDLDYIVMEYVQGETVRKMLAGGPVPADKLLEIATQIADGLGKAHSAGIVHRDLKPENLIVTGDGFVKILDFGLVKLIPQHALQDSQVTTRTRAGTRDGTIVGTAPYMSPEQAAGRSVDHRSDQFSFGSILYEMVTGEPAFLKDTVVQTMAAIIDGEPEPVLGVQPDISGDLLAVMERCLAKHPEGRYDSTRDLARDLRDLGRGRPSPTASPRRGRCIRSIAVLPLQDLAAESGQEYFAEGMTDAVTTNLAKIGALKVISRTSVARYKNREKALSEIGRELGVDAVVEGSVLLAGEGVRITAQLIDAKTDRHLWAESYERDFRDVLALQSEIARAIAHEVEVKLTPGEEKRLVQTPFVDREVYEACLKGRYHLFTATETGIRKSVQYFEQAIGMEPTYAPAYAGLAAAFCAFAWWGLLPPRKTVPRVKAAAMKALELDEANAEAHVWLAYCMTFFDWNWPSAEQELQRALELNPNDAVAHRMSSYFWNAQGRFSESSTAIGRALELDPLSPLCSSHAALPLWFGRQYDKAIQQLQETLALHEGFPVARFLLGAVKAEAGEYEDAISELEVAVGLSRFPYFRSWLGRAYGLAGQRQEAKRVLDELEELSDRMYVSSFDSARVYLGLREQDKAMACLADAYEEHSAWLSYLKVDPCVDLLRPDPRFQELLGRMNFPEWRTPVAARTP